ncbi:MAG: hypothetical protein JRD49_15775 [Deltaproteobacteria bacterium]|nr:hypothetical protein [Deltaproteobacteria bacterium]
MIKLQDEVLMQSLVRKDLKLEPKPIFPPFRAAMLGGTFHLSSTKGKGTKIRIEIPVKESSDE